MKIGISSCFLHDNPMIDVFNSRPLYYIESSFVNYLNQFNICTYIIPPNYISYNNIERTIDGVDGLILHGGVDICPLTYNENPLKKNNCAFDILGSKDLRNFDSMAPAHARTPAIRIGRGRARIVW